MPHKNEQKRVKNVKMKNLGNLKPIYLLAKVDRNGKLHR
jgi:hypothetical protein